MLYWLYSLLIFFLHFTCTSCYCILPPCPTLSKYFHFFTSLKLSTSGALGIAISPVLITARGQSCLGVLYLCELFLTSLDKGQGHAASLLWKLQEQPTLLSSLWAKTKERKKPVWQSQLMENGGNSTAKITTFVFPDWALWSSKFTERLFSVAICCEV